MEKYERNGDIVAPGQIHCRLVAFPECGYQCTKNEDLTKHIETAHAKQKCNICSETFETKTGADNHMNAKHLEVENVDTTIRFECPLCGLIKSTKSEIESHMNSHDKDNEDIRHKCDSCSYQTVNENQLVEHIEKEHIQLTERDLSCNKCKLKLINKAQLNTHMKKRT